MWEYSSRRFTVRDSRWGLILFQRLVNGAGCQIGSDPGGMWSRWEKAGESPSESLFAPCSRPDRILIPPSSDPTSHLASIYIVQVAIQPSPVTAGCREREARAICRGDEAWAIIPRVCGDVKVLVALRVHSGSETYQVPGILYQVSICNLGYNRFHPVGDTESVRSLVYRG